MAGHWQGSERLASLPANWATEIRPAILDRDGHRCTWIANLVDGGPRAYLADDYEPGNRCPATATDVDHVGPPGDHTPDNLRALCAWHHHQRSSHQGNSARAALRTQLQLPPERHPGLVEEGNAR